MATDPDNHHTARFAAANAADRSLLTLLRRPVVKLHKRITVRKARVRVRCANSWNRFRNVRKGPICRLCAGKTSRRTLLASRL